MAVDIAIKNGKVVSPTGVTETGIAVKGGKIVALAPAEYLPEAEKTIDAGGKYIIPGFVDAHAHVDTGYMAKRETYDQSFENETKAAAVGGVTTIGTMPIVESLLESFDTWVKAWENNAVADSVFHFYTSSEKHLEELPKCPELGIVTPGEMGGYKGRQAEVTSGYVDDWRLFRFLEEVARWGPPGRFMLHAENIDILIWLIERVIEEGRKDAAAWTDARPAWGEVDALQTYVLLSKVTGCPIFIVHNTCKGSVDVIKKAKDEGVDILAETCPQYLTMHKNSLHMYPPGANANPPLREEEDMEALWKGLRDGVIDTIGSDHAPWTKADKGDNIMFAPMGFGNVFSTMLPAMVTYGVNEGKISIERMVETCCYNPAKFMGVLPQKGIIAVGSDADIVIVDMEKKMVPKAADLYSSSDINVYEIMGVELKGWPVLTMLRGNIIMENGKIVGEKGTGKYIPVKLLNRK